MLPRAAFVLSLSEVPGGGSFIRSSMSVRHDRATRRTKMAKGRGGRKREVKKPKGGNKPPLASATFLPTQNNSAKPTIKDSNK